MVKTYCDKCGELIPEKEVFTVRTYNARNEIGFACYELCWACCRELAELIDQAGKPEQAELEKPEAKKEPEEQEEEAMSIEPLENRVYLCPHYGETKESR